MTLKELQDKVEKEFDEKFLFKNHAIGDPAFQMVNAPNIIQDTTELKSFLLSKLEDAYNEGKEVGFEAMKAILMREADKTLIYLAKKERDEEIREVIRNLPRYLVERHIEDPTIINAVAVEDLLAYIDRE